jgi:cystathionine beta-lyase
MQQHPYRFDAIIPRNGSNCLKYDRLEKVFGTADALALWVADMDFPTPDFILNAIRERCDHEILGYPILQEGWYTAIQSWLKSRFNWDVQQQELGFVPGIVSGMAFALQCFTKPGDRVLIQTPVYAPFFKIPEKNNREVVINPLVYHNGRFEIDFDDFEAKAASGCKAFILCSPHNPGGRIWNPEELRRMLDICKKHHLLVISDEIHADLTLPGFTHTPAALVADSDALDLITLMAPSKTFNMPGLSSSYYILQKPALKKRFEQFLEAAELSNGNIFAFVAPEAAYTHGAEWLKQLTAYLQRNVDFVDRYIRENMPRIQVCRPEASFLVWLDCRELHLSNEDLQDFFLKKARLALNPGHLFGRGGEGFMRLNIGCPQAILSEAMHRLKTAYDSLIC